MVDWNMIILIGVSGGLANMAPVIVKHIPVLGHPLDANMQWGRQRLLGSNKTWRGLFAGMLFGIIGIVLCNYLLGYQLSAQAMVWGGLLIGLGAIVGDIFFSFFKRRIRIKPGRPFIPFDQIDWILGAWLFVWPLLHPSLAVLLVLLIIGFPLHMLVNLIAYLFGLKSTYW